ncbi:hypothetical protein PVAP13_4KG346788 [Panicum virgatum]|uniref:Uncharacterized protein n=1 Tax=Panicum virgatum TaxID=38727 RepID=A0A8T0TQZ1_PANVG|nr:hypothetical protein PVAP13_4KG346788 [Panicum virgatum]
MGRNREGSLCVAPEISPNHSTLHGVRAGRGAGAAASRGAALEQSSRQRFRLVVRRRTEAAQVTQSSGAAGRRSRSIGERAGSLGSRERGGGVIPGEQPRKEANRGST